MRNDRVVKSLSTPLPISLLTLGFDVHDNDNSIINVEYGFIASRLFILYGISKLLLENGDRSIKPAELLNRIGMLEPLGSTLASMLRIRCWSVSGFGLLMFRPTFNEEKYS